MCMGVLWQGSNGSPPLQKKVCWNFHLHFSCEKKSDPKIQLTFWVFWEGVRFLFCSCPSRVIFGLSSSCFLYGTFTAKMKTTQFDFGWRLFLLLIWTISVCYFTSSFMLAAGWRFHVKSSFIITLEWNSCDSCSRPSRNSWKLFN